MPTQEYLELDVKGRKYRVGQLRANIGALLVRKIIGASGGDMRKALSMLLGGMPAEEELMLQKHLLSVVEFQKEVGANVNWLPVTDGERIFDPDLAHDTLSVWALQQASFDYNIAPFFIESGQKVVTAILAQVPRPLSSSTSTDSSSVQ